MTLSGWLTDMVRSPPSLSSELRFEVSLSFSEIQNYAILEKLTFQLNKQIRIIQEYLSTES